MTDEPRGDDPDVTLEFEHDPSAPGQARRAISGLFPDDGQLADDVSLAVSELTSNVVRHTNEGGTMAAWNRDPFRLEVSDSDNRLPLSPLHANESGGHGLNIVDEVAEKWGVDPNVGRPGKTVWANFRRPADDPECGESPSSADQ